MCIILVGNISNSKYLNYALIFRDKELYNIVLSKRHFLHVSNLQKLEGTVKKCYEHRIYK